MPASHPDSKSREHRRALRRGWRNRKRRLSELVPLEHVRTMQLEQVQDLLACPWRYRQSWVDCTTASHTEWMTARAAFDLSLKELLRARQQTGRTATREDVQQAIETALLELRPATGLELAEHVMEAVQAWYGKLGADVQPLAVDSPFSVELEQGWSMQGRVPLVFKTARAPYHQVAVPLWSIEPWTDRRLQEDLLLPWMFLGATESLGLHQLASVQLHVVVDGQLTVYDPVITQDRVARLLDTVAHCREALMAMLHVPGWWPNRLAPNCSAQQCRHASACVREFGGEVK